MNDIKNIFIAWISTSTSLFAAIELKTVLAIVSAVVMPVVFFSIGKTVDVLLQIHFRRKELSTREIRENTRKVNSLANQRESFLSDSDSE